MAVYTNPVYPLAGEQTTLAITPANGISWVFEVATRPSASTLPLAFLTLPLAPTGTAQAIINADKATNLVTFDAPGDYTITGYDFREHIGLAAFGDDPTSGRQFALRAKHSTVIHVGAAMRLPIYTSQNQGAVLQVAINDEVFDAQNRGVVRAASIVEPTDDIARVAILNEDVQAALAALVGVTVSNLGTGLQVGVNELLSAFEGHRVLTAGSVHIVPDNVNKARSYLSNSVEYSIQCLNELRVRILGHLQATTLGTRWHTVDDSLNTPVTPAASTMAQATVLMYDLRERVYERHRVQTLGPNVHGAPDNTWVVGAPKPLDTLVATFLDTLVSSVQSAPDGESEGANDASHQFGFEHI